ncbi:MAG TPA: putative collagen-binding domain-containing protein [Terriglobia bacterium]|nr:putative collagen-binding domain-containing protein [Terriglobia bacterium]
MFVIAALCALLQACAAPPESPAVHPAPSKSIKAPLRALATNPRYFTDGSGKAIYLAGSQTWNTLQDWGTNGRVRPINFTAFVKMLVKHHHNFTLLWTTELPRVHGLPSTTGSPPDITISLFPWRRTGPGKASDGKLKFDLLKFNPAFFGRLRSRVQQLDAAGIYAGVYLFSGEFINAFRSPDDGYPFTGGNNVNGIDDGGGIGSVTMTAPNAVTAYQDAYVKKMIDTLNDLPNVLWIISEEAPAKSVWWNNHLIALVRAYEATKPFQHPIGYAVRQDSNDASIINSDADWIAPAERVSPASSCGSGQPGCKVTVNDSDHSYFGMWNESTRANRNFFWINFTQGSQTLFMDPYLLDYPRENRNLPRPPVVDGMGSGPDRRWENVRNTLGYIRSYAERMALAAMAPQPTLSSTGHVLADLGRAHPEFLVYSPSGEKFTVNLSNTPGRFAVEWMNPATGSRIAGAETAGGAVRTFVPPFSGDAVLYLKLKKPGATSLLSTGALGSGN